MHKALQKALGCLAMVLPVAASAFPTFSWECANCTSDQAADYATAAEGRHLVVDFPANRSWVFQSTIGQVRRDQEGGLEILNWRIVPVAPNSMEQQHFALVREAWSTNGGSLKAHVVIDRSYPQFPPMLTPTFDAYDVVNVGANRNLLGRALVAPGFIAELPLSARNLMAALNSALVGSRILDEENITITIVFDNGSRVTFRVTRNSTQQAEYVEGKSEDSEGNPIPEGSDLAGGGAGLGGEQFIFSQQGNLDSWLRRAMSAGVPFVRSDGTRIVASPGSGTISGVGRIPSGQRARVTCRGDGSGCTVEILPI